jgi:hypothetical protein
MSTDSLGAQHNSCYIIGEGTTTVRGDVFHDAVEKPCRPLTTL